MVKKIRRYLYSFWHNSRTWQTHTHTHRQTDTAWRHRLRLCIASRGKNEFIFWLKFGLSPNLGLSNSLSETQSQKAKWPDVCYTDLSFCKLVAVVLHMIPCSRLSRLLHFNKALHEGLTLTKNQLTHVNQLFLKAEIYLKCVAFHQYEIIHYSYQTNIALVNDKCNLTYFITSFWIQSRNTV